jgi:hypothetical protein
MFTLVLGTGSRTAVTWLALRVVRSHQTTDREPGAPEDDPALPSVKAAVYAQDGVEGGLITIHPTTRVITAFALLDSGAWAASERKDDGTWVRVRTRDIGKDPALATVPAAKPEMIWVGDEPVAMSIRMQALQRLLHNGEGVPIPYLHADIVAALTTWIDALVPGDERMTLPARASIGLPIDLWPAPHQSAMHYVRATPPRAALVDAYNATWRPREAEMSGRLAEALTLYSRALTAKTLDELPHPMLVAAAARFLEREGMAQQLALAIKLMGDKRDAALRVWGPVLKQVPPEIARIAKGE